MLGVFWKIQEICSKTGTRISKIDGEMSEIIEPKVGNPENSISRNWATLSHPWNLTFFENDIFKLSSYLYGLKVPKWNCAHILLWKKAKNIRKTPKNTCFTAPWLRTTLLNDPVYAKCCTAARLEPRLCPSRGLQLLIIAAVTQIGRSSADCRKFLLALSFGTTWPGDTGCTLVLTILTLIHEQNSKRN